MAQSQKHASHSIDKRSGQRNSRPTTTSAPASAGAPHASVVAERGPSPTGHNGQPPCQRDAWTERLGVAGWNTPFLDVLRPKGASVWALPPSMPETAGKTGKTGLDGAEDRRDSYAGSRIQCGPVQVHGGPGGPGPQPVAPGNSSCRLGQARQ